MTLTLELPPDVEDRLRTNAALHGKPVTDYLVTLVENDPLIDLSEFRDMADFEESVTGVRAGLADLEAGRTISLEEMAAELKARAEKRSKHVQVAGSFEG